MHRQAADVPVRHLDLSGVHSGADLQVEPRQLVDEACGARHRPSRTVECRKATVPQQLYLATPVPLDRATHDPIVLGQEIEPTFVTERRRPRRRVHDVGEQDGGEYPTRGRCVALAGEELLDVIERGLEVTCVERNGVGSVDEAQLGARDVFGQILPERGPVEQGIAAGHHEGRSRDEGQRRPHVDLAEPLERALDQPERNRQPLIARPPGSKPRVVGHRRRRQMQHVPGRSVLSEVLLRQRIGGLGRQPYRVVVPPHQARVRIDQHQRRDPVRNGGSQHDRKQPAFGIAVGDDLLDPGSIENRDDVVDHLFHRLPDRPGRERVGDTGATHVEHGHPAHRRQPVEEPCRRGFVPDGLDVGQRPGQEDDVPVARPEDLIAEVALGGLHVLRLGTSGAPPLHRHDRRLRRGAPQATKVAPPQTRGTRPTGDAHSRGRPNLHARMLTCRRLRSCT